MNTIPLQSKDMLLMKFLGTVIPSLTRCQLENLSALCLGLLGAIPHKSIAAFSRALLSPKDQSNLNRALTRTDWGCETRSIELNAVKWFQKNRQSRFKSGGFIIIDDSLLKKSGTHMDLVGPHFDHCSFTMENGLSLVSAHYADDVKSYHLLKDIYLRKSYLKERGLLNQFKTKVDIAEGFITALLNNFPSVQEKGLTFLFDSWFLASSIVSLLQRHHIKYVSRAKSNRKILNLNMSLKEYAETVLIDADFKKRIITRRGKRELAFAHTEILPISNLGDVKVCFIKNKRKGAVKAFIVSNNLRLPELGVIKHYKERWAIETSYKDTKQYFGLDDFHIRNKQGIMRYLTLSYLVSSFLEQNKLMGTLSHALGSDCDLSTKGKQVRAYQQIIFERFLAWIDRQYEHGTSFVEIVRHFRRGRCSRSRESIQFVKHNTVLSPIIAEVGM